jgi:hypothetical protein
MLPEEPRGPDRLVSIDCRRECSLHHVALRHYGREVGIAECQLGCGAFVGLGLCHIPQCLLKLLLQSPAGGDNPSAEAV